MARGRLLNKKISLSSRVNELPLPARILYTWMVPHLDVEGRMTGNPELIGQTVIPLTNYTPVKIDEWLDMMQGQRDDATGQGLIERYEVNGNQYLYMPGFDGEQSQRAFEKGRRPAWKEREAPSEVPPPPSFTPQVKAPEPSLAEEIIDPVLGDMVKVYEENIGQLTPMLFEHINDIRKEYPEGWFAKAVEETVSHGKRNMKYIEAVLDNWQKNGLQSKKKEPKVSAGKDYSY